MKFAMTGLIVLAALAGCSSPGELINHESPDTAPKVAKVQFAGEYGLFVPGEDTPMLEFPLNAGDDIGFAKVSDGQLLWLIAIAGKQQTRLEINKPYEWRRLSP